MYIRRIEINNIRSIEHFEMTFPESKEAGWHVLIGDNGSGKSTIVRSAAVCLVDVQERAALRLVWEEWIRKNSKQGYVKLEIVNPSEDALGKSNLTIEVQNIVPAQVPFRVGPIISQSSKGIPNDGFSASFGPFRRFTGGSRDWDNVYKSYPKAAAHLSVFGEDVALTEALDYIRELYIKELDKKNIDEVIEDTFALGYILKFINGANLLPHGTRIDSVNSETISLIDGNGVIIPITQMSDGFRSILSLVLELLRQLIWTFGSVAVFHEILKGNMIIRQPGVVLIDEVDAHLHPTWQTRIGQWFTQYFPNIQFIVTTHSPLVCRAAEKGSIWRLAAPGSRQQSGEITGLDRDRLIYGNILDAYGTEVFGSDVERSDESNEKLQRLAHLSQLNAHGKLSEEGKTEMNDLRKILITDDTTEF